VTKFDIETQISTPADANSMPLSSPKAISVRLPATRPAPTATTPSTTIHAMVIHSRRNACRINAVRSGVSDSAAGMEPTHVSSQLSAKPGFPKLQFVMLETPLIGLFAEVLAVSEKWKWETSRQFAEVSSLGYLDSEDGSS
jgi:hypothetical protein